MKKTILNLFVLLALFAIVFSSCKDDDNDDKKPVVSGLTIKGSDITNATDTKAFKADATIAFGSKVSFNAFDGETELKQVDWSVSPALPSGVSEANGAEGSYLITVGNYALTADKEYTLTGKATKSGSIKFKLKKRTATTETTTLSVDAFKGETQYKSSDEIEISSSGGTATATTLSFVLSNKAKDTKWTIAPALPTAGITVVDAEGSYTLVIANYTLAKDTEYTVTGKSGDKSATRKFTLKAATVTAKSKEAKLTGVLYAGKQYAKPNNTNKEVALTFVKPEEATQGVNKVFFTISAGAKITKPATGVTKTSADHVKAANTFLASKAIPGAPEKLGDDANVWEMALPTAAGDVPVEVTAEDGTTTDNYTLKIVASAAAISVDAFKADQTKYGAAEALEFSSTGATMTTAETVIFRLSNEAADTQWTIAPALPATGITEDKTQGVYTLVIANYTLAADGEYTVTGTSGGKSVTRKFTLKKHEATIPAVTGDLTASDAFTFVATLKVEAGTDDTKKVVTVTGKLPTKDGKQYVAWSVVDGTTASDPKVKTNIGALTFASEKALLDSVPADKVVDTADFVVTIEDAADATAAAALAGPAGPAIWKGDFKNGKIMLGTEVAAISGSYILATPSDNPTKTDNEANGIWFLKEGTPKTAGLVLPDLTGTDFVYEGWIVINAGDADKEVAVSTGKFTKPAGADTGKLYYDGNGPAFPGEDFLKNPADGETGQLAEAVFTALVPLNGKKVVISLELKDDTDLVPYFIKPLNGTVPTAAK